MQKDNINKNFEKIINTNQIWLRRHLFHLVHLSPWPIFLALSVLSLMTSLLIYFHHFESDSIITIDLYDYTSYFLIKEFFYLVYNYLMLGGNFLISIAIGELVLNNSIIPLRYTLGYLSVMFIRYDMDTSLVTEPLIRDFEFLRSNEIALDFLFLELENLRLILLLNGFNVIFMKPGAMVVYSLLLTILIIFSWLKDIINEATFGGNHTFIVQKGLRLGIILFIVSEIMFFFGFFWTYFHSALVPPITLGSVWPHVRISSFEAFTLPLLNTLLLVSSGFTITKAHEYFSIRKLNFTILYLIITIFLGSIFLFSQLIEYFSMTFNIDYGIFSSIFYVSTGFHGLHVFIGLVMLIHFYKRLKNVKKESHLEILKYRKKKGYLKILKKSYSIINLLRKNFITINQSVHLGLIASIWYWHFVDVVWLFLYLFIYLWPSILRNWCYIYEDIYYI